jgi:protein-disulfide isomerase
MKKLIIGLLIIGGVLGGVFLLTREKSAENNSEQISQSNSTTDDRGTSSTNLSPDLVIGSPNAKATIVEYADFKCPTCNRFHREAGKEVREKYLETGKAKIVFRNLPFIAEDSRTAAEGAYCANDQSKFVQYHDLLFNHIYDEYYSKGKITEGEAAPVFSADNLTQLVKQIGVDQVAFGSCLTEGKFKDAVTSDLSQSKDDGATGTPTFIISGQKLVGAQPFSVYDKLISIGL